MSCSRTQHSDAGEARTTAPRSRVKHSTTEPLCSLQNLIYMTNIKHKADWGHKSQVSRLNFKGKDTVFNNVFSTIQRI